MNDIDFIDRIMETGDDVTLSEVLKDCSTDVYEELWDSVLMCKDVALFHRLAQHPNCGSFIPDIQSLCATLMDPDHNVLLKNTFFMAEIFKIMEQKNVSINDEPHLKSFLLEAVSQGCKPGILNQIDDLWLKSYSCNNWSDLHFLRSFYENIQHKKQIIFHSVHYVDIRGLLNKALFLRIKRHIKVLWDILKTDKSLRMALTHYEQVRLYLFNEKTTLVSYDRFDSNSSISVDSIEEWKDFENTISTFIPLQPISQNAPETLAVTTVAQLLTLLDSNQGGREWNVVTRTVVDFIKGTCEELSKMEPDYACTPVLVGSASEGTRCFVPNEFDFTLLFPQYAYARWLEGTFCGFIRAALQKQRAKGTSFIADDFLLMNNGKYPCLHIWWNDQKYINMKITIDLVPSFERDTPRRELPSHQEPRLKAFSKDHRLPYHAYCPQVHEQSFESSEESSHLLEKVFASQTLGGDFAGGLSLIENETIRSLPRAIREGYQLAKAMRVSDIVHPILSQLIQLSVADDVQDIVRSYMLKSGVFVITQYSHLDHHEGRYDRFYWCVRIYEQLRRFVYDGFLPGFFSDEKLFFRLPRAHECKQGRYRCCRQSQAVLLIVDRILYVLKLWRRCNKKPSPVDLFLDKI